MRPRGSKAELEERPRTAVKLLKRYGVREVARRVGASPGSVERWKKMYETGGVRALRAKPDRVRHRNCHPRTRRGSRHCCSKGQEHTVTRPSCGRWSAWRR